MTERHAPVAKFAIHISQCWKKTHRWGTGSPSKWPAFYHTLPSLHTPQQCSKWAIVKLTSASKAKNYLFLNWFHDIRSHLIWIVYFTVLMQYHTYWQAVLVQERLGQALRLWPALPQTKQPTSVFSQLCFWRVQQLQLLQWNQAAKYIIWFMILEKFRMTILKLSFKYRPQYQVFNSGLALQRWM